jgi:dTDP-3-amino-3,4,6-trideoxy-alpha-D-glucose transaminase
MTSVPFVDLTAANEAVRDDVLADLDGLIRSGAFTNGPAVQAFEQQFADYCGATFCVGVASGLDAIRLALIAAGANGGEVIVPALTFAATFEAIVQAGAVPRVVDVTELDYNIDPAAVDAAASRRARIVVPVHLYGQLADMRALAEIARERALDVVEDACQAHGAMRDDIRPGMTSEAAAFSFYPSKNLGAFGDAGALVTGSETLAGRVRSLREHGEVAKYRHTEVGYTARLDAVQATVLARKLVLLERWNAERADAAAFYFRELRDVGDLVLPPVPKGSLPAWHLYVIRTREPERLGDFLALRGIATGRHYPEPPHLARAYAGLGHREGAFPASEAIAREALSLPIFPGISTGQLTLVCEAIAEFFRHAGSTG